MNTFGLEVYIENNFYKYFIFSFSNSFIDKKVKINNYNYRGSKDFDYFVKSTIQYNNPKLFSLALIHTNRSVIYYNEIIGGTFDSQTNFYESIFYTKIYNSKYNNYNHFDISLSKYIKMKKNALITFISLNNIFNTKNKSVALYSTDY